jgi:D-sedoheptulose 7-phosphate isomerase
VTEHRPGEGERGGTRRSPSGGEGGLTDFLYPFIDADERDAGPLLADLAASADAKTEETMRLRASTLELLGPELDRTASAMAERFAAGGRLLAFGNGGSATDAAGAVALFRTPPWGRSLPARSLVADEAVLTALANDVGFELVFSRQVIAYGRRDDVALGLSTSGNSTNVLRAMEEARKRGLLTVGLAGYLGGEMAGAALDHCLVVRADSVHRIQETQNALLSALWKRIQSRLERVA